MMQKAMEMMQQQNGRMTPEQMAMMQKTMGQMQGAASQPLSREETKAVFDEMAAMGLLTDTLRDEAKDCITYAPPGAGDSLGGAGRCSRTRYSRRRGRRRSAWPRRHRRSRSSSPTAWSTRSIRLPPPTARRFLDGFGSGFFPAPVVEQVRARSSREAATPAEFAAFIAAESAKYAKIIGAGRGETRVADCCAARFECCVAVSIP